MIRDHNSIADITLNYLNMNETYPLAIEPGNGNGTLFMATQTQTGIAGICGYSSRDIYGISWVLIHIHM